MPSHFVNASFWQIAINIVGKVIRRFVYFFTFAEFVFTKVVDCIFVLNWIHRTHFFQVLLAGFSGQGVLNKVPTVWINGPNPANTYIPLSSPRNAPSYMYCINTQKYICKYKILPNLAKFRKKIKEKVQQTHYLATVSLSNSGFNIFTSLTNPVSTFTDEKKSKEDCG